MAETELERAEKRYAQAKVRLQALCNREATKQRKLATVLGGLIMIEDHGARKEVFWARLVG